MAIFISNSLLDCFSLLGLKEVYKMPDFSLSIFYNIAQKTTLCLIKKQNKHSSKDGTNNELV